jgi:HEAT repeat protein
MRCVWQTLIRAQQSIGIERKGNPMKKSSEQKLTKFQKALQRLADEQDTPQLVDVNALASPTPADIEHFRAVWQTIAVARRRAIVAAMNEASELSVHSDFSDLLPLLLDDADEVVRAAAIEGLRENEKPSLGRRLLRMLEADKAELVRAAAARALGDFILRAELGKLNPDLSNKIMETLLARYNDVNEDEEVRRHALESVAYATDERVHGAIDRAYHDGDHDMRASALCAMGRTADKTWERIVLRELRSKDAAMRYEAANAAGELMLHDALPILGELVHDADWEVRESAVWALGQIGGKEARHVLESVLASDDEALHEAAEDALAELEFTEGDVVFDLFEYTPDTPTNGRKSQADEEGGE